MFEFIIEFFGDIVFKLVSLIIYNKKIPFAIRFIFASVFSLFMLIVQLLLIAGGILMLMDGEMLGIFVMLIGVIFFVAVVYRLIIEIIKYQNKRESDKLD